MKKIRIAQIGIGHDHASAIFETLINLPEVFEVVGYAEVPEDDFDDESQRALLKNSQRVYEGSTKYTVDEILSMDDLDAVAIETYDLNLVRYAQMAADRGLKIHMDKAGGESAEEFEKLLSTVKNKRLAFSMGYMYRYNPVIKQAFESVERGELGKLFSISAQMDCYHGREKREWLGSLRGGMMLYLGCHLIDLIVRLQGVPNDIIPYNYSSGADGVSSLDNAFALLKYDGAIASVKSSALDSGGYVRRSLVINGEKGTIEIRPLEEYAFTPAGITTTVTRFNPSDGWLGTGRSNKSQPFNRYEEMLLAFARNIRGEEKPLVDLETEARVQRCLLAACGISVDYKGKIKL